MNNWALLMAVIGRIHSARVVIILETGFVVSNNGKIASFRYLVADEKLYKKE